MTKISSSGTPRLVSVGAKAAQATRAARVIAQTLRGVRSTRSATRCHRRWLPPVPVTLGRAGLQAARPSRTRAAGRKVSALKTEQTMPIAPTGPSARLLVRSLRSRASRPSATVAALAVIGPNDCRQASRIAVNRSPCRLSSSRNRAVSRSA